MPKHCFYDTGPAVLCPGKRSHTKLEVELHNNISFTICLWVFENVTISQTVIVSNRTDRVLRHRSKCSTKICLFLKQNFFKLTANITIRNVTDADMGANRFTIITKYQSIKKQKVIYYTITVQSKGKCFLFLFLF